MTTAALLALTEEAVWPEAAWKETPAGTAFCRARVGPWEVLVTQTGARSEGMSETIELRRMDKGVLLEPRPGESHSVTRAGSFAREPAWDRARLLLRGHLLRETLVESVGGMVSHTNTQYDGEYWGCELCPGTSSIPGRLPHAPGCPAALVAELREMERSA